MKKKGNKVKKLYTIICKVDNEKFVKYNCNDLLSLTRFLDKNWNGWRWYNVYSKSTKEQLANYTNKNRPITKKL